MTVFRLVAKFLVVSVLIATWVMPAAAACPEDTDLTMPMSMHGSDDCCPETNEDNPMPDMPCAAMVGCKLPTPQFDVRLEAQHAPYVVTSVEWLGLIEDSHTQFDLVPPGHPPRS